jgi:KipI family sensor histidine kinase inhibitor
MNDARFEPLGDRAILIQLGARIDQQLNTRALALADNVRAARLPGVLDVAAAYASVCVRYDPAAWLDAAHSPFAELSARLGSIVDNAAAASATLDNDAIVDGSILDGSILDNTILEIPVRYGGESGPDLEAVAQHAGLRVEEVITRHCAGDYRVAMLGFAPGFAYLLGLDAALHVPRRATPRTRVPAGSVAIGGAQTGIYPRELPGGWQIIGHTALTLFDPAHDPPTLLTPGKRVRFHRVEHEPA